MRYLRHKQNRKTMHHYRMMYGIAPPYRVLLDGNFIAVAAKMDQSVEDRVPALLGDRVFLHVTECAVRELAALGPKLAPALAAARRIAVIRCSHKHGHGADMDAGSCIRSLVGATNEGHWVVGTQDADLRDALRKIPGVPLMLFSKNVLVLEALSADTRAATASAESDKSGLTADERRAVAAALAAAGGAGGGGGGGGGGTGGGVIVGSVSGGGGGGSSSSSARGGGAGTKRTRRGPSAPNPLAVKRKAAPVAAGRAAGPAPPPAPAAATDRDAGGGKTTRRAGRKVKRARGDGAADAGGAAVGGGYGSGGDSS